MADPVVVRSSIQSVSVFRSGAVVTRSAPLPGGTPDEIAIDGLPLALEDDSVRVRVEGEGSAARPTDVRVLLVVPPIGETLEPPSQKEIREAEDELERLSTLHSRIEQEIAFLDRIGFQLPPVFQNRPPRPAPAAAWSGSLEWTGRSKKARLEEKAKVREQLRDAEEALARLQRREELAAANRDASDEKVRKRVVVRLRDGAANGTIRLEYRVPGACWRPNYVLRMARDGRSAMLALRALVVQDSGEPWERVKLSLSTADLLARAEIPELKSIRLGRKQPESPSRAWREPPSGLEALFEGLDNASSGEPDLPPPSDPEPEVRFKDSTVEKKKAEPMAERRPMPKSGAPANRPAAAPATVSTPTQAPPSPPPMDSMSSIAPAEERSRAPAASRGGLLGGLAGAFGAGGGSSAGPMAPGAPAPMRSRAADYDRKEMQAEMEDGAGMDLDEGGVADKPSLHRGRSSARRPDPSTLRYADLVMAPWTDEEWPRGKLRPITMADRLRGLDPGHADTVESRIYEAVEQAEGAASVTFPDSTRPVGESAGSYDYRYDAEGMVDVPSDGKIHSVPLFGRRAPVAMTLVVVPRESTQAVRVASMKNPLEAPLLEGPAEIYLEDEYLVTSPVRTVPPGAELKIGLGVEEALKVARNVHFDEEKAGILGGSATLEHRVEIEVASKMPMPVRVEVRERVPIKNDEKDKDVEITVPEPTPAWEDFDQADTAKIKGGKRWRFSLSANETKKLSWTYTIKIDAKNEVVGGNRRE